MKIQTIDKIANWIAIFIFLAGLALFAYAGTYSRFWADDYCYSAMIQQKGLLKGLVEWYHTGGNRVSTLLAVALADGFGWRTIQISPLLVLAGLSTAWIFFLVQLGRVFQWGAARPWLALLALVEVYFAVLLAPDRVQALYWRMGTDHYTLPFVLLFFNLGLIARSYARNETRPAWIAAASALLAFLAAGFSETFATLQGAALGMALGAALLFLPRQRLVGWLAAALGGSLMMMYLMILSPANAWRQAVMPPPDNLLLIFPAALHYTGDFILYTVRGHITPFAVYILLVGLLGWLAFPVDRVYIPPRSGLVWAGAVLFVMYGLIFCSFLPSAYAALSYPAGRALMPGSITLLAGLGCVALILGLTLRSALPFANRGWVTVIAMVALVLLSAYPLRAAAVARTDIGQLAERAARWDERNRQIRQEIAAGQPDLTVRQVDVVLGLEDLGPDAAHWVNQCAASYYGVRSITAKP